MNRTIDLAVKVATEADVDGLDRVGAAAGDMATKVDAGADKASRSLDLMSSSADNLDDKGSKATGALGALSSGFELMGPKGEAAAAALQTAAMATDFMSGAGQALNLIMDLDIVKKTASTAATIGHTVATTASTAAAKVAAAGQWALNAALSANPIGLVVVALVALAAGVVLAYQKSETFREVVDGAFKVAKAAVSTTVDVIGDLVTWFRDKIPPAVDVVKSKVAPALELAFLPLLTTIDVAGNLVEIARDKIPGAIEGMKNKVVPLLDAIVAPIKAAYDTMTSLVDKIQSIDFPDLPKLPGNPFNRLALPGAATPAASTPTTTAVVFDERVIQLLTAILTALTSPGSVDQSVVARAIAQLLNREANMNGTVTFS